MKIEFTAELKDRGCIIHDKDRSARITLIAPSEGLDLNALKESTERDVLLSIMPGNFVFHASIERGGIRYEGDNAWLIKLTVPANDVAQSVKFISYTEKVFAVQIETEKP